MCVLLELRKYFKYSSKRKFHYLLSNLNEKGLLYIHKHYNVYHFSIPSKGSHEAVNFLWKQSKNEESATPEHRKLIHGMQSKEVRYYNRDTKRELKKQLLMLCVTSSKHVEFLMQDILWDNLAPTNEDQ